MSGLVRLWRRCRFRCPDCGMYRCFSNPYLPDVYKAGMVHTYGPDLGCQQVSP